jgi:hypothetical protein
MAANSFRRTQEGAMAKIHAQGGSDLQIKFTDEGGADLYPVRLEPAKWGPWYTVVAEKDGKKLQANKRPGNEKYFRSSGDIEIDFKSS